MIGFIQTLTALLVGAGLTYLFSKRPPTPPAASGRVPVHDVVPVYNRIPAPSLN